MVGFAVVLVWQFNRGWLRSKQQPLQARGRLASLASFSRTPLYHSLTAPFICSGCKNTDDYVWFRLTFRQVAYPCGIDLSDFRNSLGAIKILKRCSNLYVVDHLLPGITKSQAALKREIATK